MATITPIFRIFDYQKALEFYVSWLGFKVDWEDKPDNAPHYLQVSLQDMHLHLTEHHGDCTPGARAYISLFKDLKEYHHQLLAKPYKFNRPELEATTLGGNTLAMEVIDPFGNRLTFHGR
ncbi:bleomycin resistance protein [Rufibacter sp. DG15C]|uniref:glyoxalase superfamily protein n=1 Tax=Rufibacter sp. DG15C TaxID=1379909 RepID=UPI00078C309A|nr:glyoxalase/bleomycin resistance/extradiol dioxygenase family protein [Rufibacter sp. DG15C]AMM51157.1 bleomycin resistance protein [Rufibacter sp. DG15C]